MKERLTQRQQQVLDFISRCLQERGFPPTLREIGEHMGIRSTNGVNDHLKALERKGYLIREGLKSRALRPVYPPGSALASGAAASSAGAESGINEPAGASGLPAGPGPGPGPGPGRRWGGASAANDDAVEVAVLGRVAAGAPILAAENVVDRVRIDRFFLGQGSRDVFGLVVQGESMIEAGIHDGDYLFVNKQSTAAQGEIVVVMIDGEATCKYFFRDTEKIRLEPANAAMQPIVVHASDFRSVHILGKVVGVYRKMH